MCRQYRCRLTQAVSRYPLNGGQVRSVLAGVDQSEIQPRLPSSPPRLPIPQDQAQPDPVADNFRFIATQPADVAETELNPSQLQK